MQYRGQKTQRQMTFWGQSQETGRLDTKYTLFSLHDGETRVFSSFSWISYESEQRTMENKDHRVHYLYFMTLLFYIHGDQNLPVSLPQFAISNLVSMYLMNLCLSWGWLFWKFLMKIINECSRNRCFKKTYLFLFLCICVGFRVCLVLMPGSLRG